MTSILKTLLLSIATLVSGCAVIDQSTTGIVYGNSKPDYDTPFPQGTLFQEDQLFQAKVAYPVDGISAVWVKGSSKFSWVKIIDSMNGKVVVEPLELMAPHFTDSLNLPSVNPVYAEFYTSDQNVLQASENRLYLEPVNTMNVAEGEAYSILLYGCFQPFTVIEGDSGLRSALYVGENSYATSFLGFFRDVGLSEKLHKGEPVLPNTKLVIGTGDQVYVDAGYEGIVPTLTNNHPLSLWTVEQQPKTLKTGNDYAEHIDHMYRAFGSFKSLNDVFRAIPQINVWDDHDIRDGWGSQGDEDRYFQEFSLARQAYVNHQITYEPIKKAESNALDQVFNVGKFEGYAFDLRSNRNINNEGYPVVSQDQIEEFTLWLSDKNNQEVIIVSSMPFFQRNNDFAESKVGQILPELLDDLADGWGSKGNKHQRNEILEKILEARITRGVIPIFVSGDYHKTSLSELWFYKEKSMDNQKLVFGYEMLATGLYHEGLPHGVKSSLMSRAESQRVGDHFIDDLSFNDASYTIEPYVKKSDGTENFGGISVDENGQTRLSIFINEGNGDARVSYIDIDANKNFILANERDDGFSLYRFFLNLWPGNWNNPYYAVEIAESYTVKYIE